MRQAGCGLAPRLYMDRYSRSSALAGVNLNMCVCALYLA